MELPSSEAIDEQWGGCRGVESAYEKTHQIGEGTYGQVRYQRSPIVHSSLLDGPMQRSYGCLPSALLLLALLSSSTPA